ncbi:hypothetical protein [Arabidopsis thaliana]|uniref:F6N23.13 protein n=1 Tax=Arabidopsis thaliana TaxID=3702 RepID=O65276_ARATH|nr:F6N23.13 gene product [Arabidopsis thaliana]CAB80876.1 hypothetical protein [Arabidopsis thaliana]
MEPNIPIQRGNSYHRVLVLFSFMLTQKKLLDISGWEKKKTTKIESELARIQRKMDSKKMEKSEKLRNEKAAVHAKAQKKKADVQTRRAQEILDAEEAAARFQAAGKIPKKSSLSCF